MYNYAHPKKRQSIEKFFFEKWDQNEIHIGIVTYNRLPYIQKCVWSIVASTLLPYKLFVIDDCSTDGTREWLIEMKRRGVIHEAILNEENIGTANAFNRLINQLKDNWVVFGNDDFWYHRWWDYCCLDMINRYKDCGIVSFYYHPKMITEATSYYPKNKTCIPVDVDVIKSLGTGFGAVMMLKELYIKTGGFQLPEGQKMGIFTRYFWPKMQEVAKREKIKRHMVYWPKPSYARNMDIQNWALNEIDYVTDQNGYLVHKGKWRSVAIAYEPYEE